MPNDLVNKTSNSTLTGNSSGGCSNGNKRQMGLRSGSKSDRMKNKHKKQQVDFTNDINKAQPSSTNTKPVEAEPSVNMKFYHAEKGRKVEDACRYAKSLGKNSF